MKPVSSSDMDCYKNFEYLEILKKRYGDEEDEEVEAQQYCNPAFRLEVSRHNDAATFDCRCDGPETEMPDGNANAAESSVVRLRKSTTTHMMRKCPANTASSEPKIPGNCSQDKSKDNLPHNQRVFGGGSKIGRQGGGGGGGGGLSGRGVNFLTEESAHLHVNRNRAATSESYLLCREASKECGCGHCEEKQKSKCSCGKPHAKMEKIPAHVEKTPAKLPPTASCSRGFNPLIRYIRKEPVDFGYGPPDDFAECSGRTVPRPPEEPLMLSYPRERVPLDVFERYVREQQMG